MFRFVERERAHHPVHTMCRLLDVSASGYWAWQRRGVSARALSDAELTERIRQAHADSRGTYGVPRIHAELQAAGIGCGRKRVARLMRHAGLAGVRRRRFVRTTRRDPDARPAPDLVERDFARDAPDQLWVADITYLPTRAGFGYLATILDAWSRRVVGWAVAGHLRTPLVSAALAMALAGRQPRPGLVHHSDHGVQYTSLAFGARLVEAGIAASMGSIGDAYDNAMAGSGPASTRPGATWPTTSQPSTTHGAAIRRSATSPRSNLNGGIVSRRRVHKSTVHQSGATPHSTGTAAHVACRFQVANARPQLPVVMSSSPASRARCMNHAKSDNATGMATATVITRKSITWPFENWPMSPGDPWPRRPRRDASSHQVVGDAKAIGCRTPGRMSIGKIAPETRYSAPAMASG